MNGKTIRRLAFIVLLVTLSAGLTAAHDTGLAHTHDLSSESAGVSFASSAAETNVAHSYLSDSMPLAFLIIPINGEMFPYHWLWHAMRGEKIDNRIHLLHELLGWYDIPHFHESAALVDGGDQNNALLR